MHAVSTTADFRSISEYDGMFGSWQASLINEDDRRQ